MLFVKLRKQLLVRSFVSGRKKKRKRALRWGFVASKQDAGTKMCPEALLICHFGSRHRENCSARISSHRYDRLNKALQLPVCKGMPCKHCFWSTAWSILAKFPFWQALPRTEFKPALLRLSGLTRILGSGDNCTMSLELQRTKSKQKSGEIQTDGIRVAYLWCWIQSQS